MNTVTGERFCLPLRSLASPERPQNHLSLVEIPAQTAALTLLPTRSSRPFELEPRLQLRSLGPWGLTLFTLHRLGLSYVAKGLRHQGFSGFKQGLRRTFSPNWNDWLAFHSDWDEFDHQAARALWTGGNPSFLCIGETPDSWVPYAGLSLSFYSFPTVGELRESGELDRHRLVILRSPDDQFLDHAFPLLAIAEGQHPQTQVFYADEERHVGNQRELRAKPAWSPLLHRLSEFPGTVLAIRPEVLSAIPGPIELNARAILQALPSDITPHHLPYAISFKTANPTPPVASLPPISTQNHLPTVEAIIPTRDRLDLLEPLVKDLRRTPYPHLRVTIVDHGSRDPKTLKFLDECRSEGHKVVAVDGPFNFSRLCNRGAENSTADALLLLNNDLRMPDPSWLQTMVSLLEEGVGAVGALLLFPSGRIQHAGVALGMGQGVAGHIFRGCLPREVDSTFFSNPREVSAVTAACLLTPRTLWEKVGGFDEKSLPVAYNDVHFCLRLRTLGQRILWTPHAVLEHLESESRGADQSGEHRLRLDLEANAMKSFWGDQLRNDPYYHPALSLKSEQPDPAMDPRLIFPWRDGHSRVNLRSPSFGSGPQITLGQQIP